MKTNIQIKSTNDILLFEYECENNTVRKTVEKAVKEKADLSYANLSYANLRCADLRSANLSLADLSSANLRLADLSCADLSRADLRLADLSCADLSSADLSSADLSKTNLIDSKNKKLAKLPIYCKWSSSIIGNKIQIGCKTMTIKEWDLFFESLEEFQTKRGTEEFKQIQAVYLANKSYLTFLNN